jgi:fructoselysine-6-P-deglycase FrlB-like protein
MRDAMRSQPEQLARLLADAGPAEGGRGHRGAGRALCRAERELGEPLSVFTLTVVVQRIAAELAEARGVSPDRFRYEEDPRREAAFEAPGS